MNRRTFLKTSAIAAAGLYAGRGRGAETQHAVVSDDEILAQAKQRIKDHRSGDGVVVVRDAGGKAMPGAQVSIDQVRHDFLFGCNLFAFNHCPTPALEQAYRQRFAAIFNYATLGFYWASYEEVRGHPQYDYTDAVVAWAREHGIACKGHPLAWDHPASSPAWLPDDPKEIERLSTGRVRDIVSRFRGRIDRWDVVNEPTHLMQKVNKSKMADWAASLGQVPYVTEHLKVARAANPSATLLVNDYRLEPRYYEILDQLRQDGKLLFDAVGIQSHQHDGPWPLHKVWEICDTYAKLGLPIHFTETTLVSGPRKGPGENWGATTPEGEARQAEQTARFYTTLFAHPAVQAITWWDFTDLNAWQGAAAGWVRADMSPKPVYERLLSLVKGDWQTKASGQTDAEGEFKTRAFFGDVRVTVKAPNGATMTKDCTWRRDDPNRFELRLAK